MDNYEKTRVRKHVHHLVSKGMLIGKRIVLFGASGFSKDVLTCLREHGYEADAVVDNDSRKIGIRCLGMIVKKSEDALLPYSDATVILFYSPGFYKEITAQLENMGYEKKRHIFVMNAKTDDSLLSFANMTVLKIRGLWWYNKIKRGHTASCKLFIAPYTGTGDIYLAGLFLKEYIKRESITDYVFAVVSNACRRVAEMFDIQHIVVLPHEVSDNIISLEKTTRKDLNIVVLNDGWLGDPLQWLRGYKGLNFEKMFRYFVFGFGDDAAFSLPPAKDNTAALDALFDKYGLIKGKTVVLSPYSNTLFDLPVEVLQTIVGCLKELGFAVCTNCAGSEKPIEGTAAVFFPLNQAIAFMDAAGYFVGVRSGLCDVISSSNCKKIIFYEKGGLFYKSSQYGYFNLKEMGLCEDALELEYRDDTWDEIIGALLSLFEREVNGR